MKGIDLTESKTERDRHLLAIATSTQAEENELHPGKRREINTRNDQGLVKEEIETTETNTTENTNSVPLQENEEIASKRREAGLRNQSLKGLNGSQR